MRLKTFIIFIYSLILLLFRIVFFNRFIERISSVTKITVINLFSKNFFQFKLTAKVPSLKLSYYDNFNSDVTIIIHGPIIKWNKFTIKTIDLYANRFPATMIFLVTWDDEKSYIEKNILPNLVRVFYLKKPNFSGVLNLNYQLVKLQSVLPKVDTKRTLITRTDMRLYRLKSLSQLESYFFQYRSPKSNLIKNRIITVNILTRKFILFSLSEVFQFGSTEDLRRYWSLNVSDLDLTRSEYFKVVNKTDDYLGFKNPEMLLLTNYLVSNNINFEYTFDSYMSVLREFFVVIDADQLELFWYKYSIRQDYFINSSINTKFEIFDNIDWNLNYYNTEMFLLNEASRYERFRSY